jgi:putative transposase
MPEYRRSFLPGGSFFFTVVTYNRQPFLVSPEARAILHAAWMDVQQRFPFTTDAICLLPDHLHCNWTLPEGDTNYSVRWKEIKRLFSKEYGYQMELTEARSASRVKRGERTVWQRRFWEHTLRDEADWRQHMDYIHYNPVKHGWVQRVKDWEWSSFHRYVKMGFYDAEWGGKEKVDIPLICGE